MAMIRATPSSASAPVPSAGSRGRVLRAAIVAGSGVFVAVLMAAAGLLWVRNGTSVFFETVSAGLAACF